VQQIQGTPQHVQQAQATAQRLMHIADEASLKKTATDCNTLQLVATQHLMHIVDKAVLDPRHTLQRTATRCNALHPTATCYDTLQHAATLFNAATIELHPLPACVAVGMARDGAADGNVAASSRELLQAGEELRWV